ncbi:hypothetical protein [Sphingopyxis sp. BSNA05]|uniref:hypothetical protein n=1 Tax=Sphingopyxis sp. BSNA05 TaxID=1236614 RepID=UPI001564C2C8|nr:hypothetical protein [Sphingopyxis sp. BSNA05]
MANIDELEDQLSNVMAERANRFKITSVFVKGGLIAGGAAIATIAQFLLPTTAGGEWAKYAGIFASFLVFWVGCMSF